MKNIVYMDNAATTKMSSAVLEAMMPCLTEVYGNPSSLYSLGQQSRKAVEDARELVAEILGAQPKEIFFTSGGSESDNWAIRSLAIAGAKRDKKHIISTKFEHHAVLHTLEDLEKMGFEVTYLDVGNKGIVSVDELERVLREDTAFVTIMYANNEIGTVQPIAEIGRVCRERKVPFHTDAVQAVGHIPVNVERDNVDLLSLSAHKFHGPKGVGVLYCRKTIKLPNLITGGGQERGKRAGTENVAGIVGLAKALEESAGRMEQDNVKIAGLRDKLIEGILKIPYVRLNGDRTRRLPGNVNVSIEGIEGESLLLSLDMVGVCASSGSACTSGSLDPSHVLMSIGLPHEIAHGSLRLSLDRYNTSEEADYVLEVLPPIVERLRSMSPLWERMEKDRQKERNEG